jgi:hypothetical protein
MSVSPYNLLKITPPKNTMFIQITKLVLIILDPYHYNIYSQ